jgi:hypothetical protein
MRPSATRRLVAAAFAAGLLFPGCLSPTLPLPPPEAPQAIQQNADGTWTIVGECSPGAFVTVFVERAGLGAVIEDRDADGRYAVDIKAERCDVVAIWQQDGAETSASNRAIVQEVENGLPLDSSECVR